MADLILNGDKPVSLSLAGVPKIMPISWTEQRHAFGPLQSDRTKGRT